MKPQVVCLTFALFLGFCTQPPKEYESYEILKIDLATDSDAVIISEGAPLRFPSSALTAGKSGLVEISLLVDKKGKVSDASILNEEPMGYGFGEASKDHAFKLKFRPAVLKGQCVSQRFIRRYDFNLSLYQIEKR